MSIKPVKIPGVGMRNVKTALAAAFCAAWFAEVSVVLIILCCGLIGAADTLWSRRKGAVS